MIWDSFMLYMLFVHVYMPYYEPVNIIYYILFTSALYFDLMWEDFNYAEVQYYSWQLKHMHSYVTHCFPGLKHKYCQGSGNTGLVSQSYTSYTCQTFLHRETAPTLAIVIAPHELTCHHITYRTRKILSHVLYNMYIKYH
jgi:hypothetical protein